MNYVGFMDWVDGINDAMMMAGRELLVSFGWFLQVRLLLIHEENSFFSEIRTCLYHSLNSFLSCLSTAQWHKTMVH